MLNPDYDNNNTTFASTSSRRQYIGYIPDLLQELSYIIHFDYHIQPVHDASFGHRRLDGTWDGMVGQLIDGVSPTPLQRTGGTRRPIDFQFNCAYTRGASIKPRRHIGSIWGGPKKSATIKNHH